MKRKVFVFLAVVLAITLMALPTLTARAWNAPIVASLCAPDESHFSFKVTVTAESDYNMEWSFDPGFAGATSITLILGDNIIPPVARGSHVTGDLWYIRFQSDHSVVASTHSDGTLCNTPTPTNTLVSTPTNTLVSTPTNTLVSTPTNTLVSTPTNTLVSTPTNTSVFTPTKTSVFTPTNTSVFTPTKTSVFTPTNTSVFTPTNTSVFTPTNTSVFTPTNTSVPTQESTPIPPPVTGASGGPNGSPILPIAGGLVLFGLLGIALKLRKANGLAK
jgi:hypothetical protein